MKNEWRCGQTQSVITDSMFQVCLADGCTGEHRDETKKKNPQRIHIISKNLSSSLTVRCGFCALVALNGVGRVCNRTTSTPFLFLFIYRCQWLLFFRPVARELLLLLLDGSICVYCAFTVAFTLYASMPDAHLDSLNCPGRNNSISKWSIWSIAGLVVDSTSVKFRPHLSPVQLGSITHSEQWL